MSLPDERTDFGAPTAPEVRQGSERLATIIEDEPQWRLRPHGSAVALSGAKVIATRWRAFHGRKEEFGAETAQDGCVVKVVLRTSNIQFSVAGRTVLDGLATPGMFHVTEPSTRARCLFRGPYDILHLHVPNTLIVECGRDLLRHHLAALGARVNLRRDPTVEGLARALLAADQIGGSLGQIYAEYISIAIVARIFTFESKPGSAERRRVAELPYWRLKRAIEYIEAHLAEPVTLVDMASAAGVTRMHFAAQFRAATGLRPHEYLLRRRIERAQEELVRTGMSLVDVALSVGFPTQSHFGSVFKRFVGRPPSAWRQLQSDENTRKIDGRKDLGEPHDRAMLDGDW